MTLLHFCGSEKSRFVIYFKRTSETICQMFGETQFKELVLTKQHRVYGIII